MIIRNAVAAALLVAVVLTVPACTSPEPPPVPTAAPAPGVTAQPTATPVPTDTPVPLPTATTPPTPTFTAKPTDTPAPPTATPPAPTYTPRPLLPTNTLRPAPTHTPRPTRTPRPTSTPQPPSPIADLENGAWLERNERARAAEIRELPWVADGVDHSERTAAELLIAAARWYPETFRFLHRQPWVQDSITGAETSAIHGLRWTARYAPELIEPMSRKPWLQDDITRDEATVIDYLFWMIWYEEEPDRQVIKTAAQVLDMPFLESVEGADAATVRSLERLGDNDTDALLEIMSHPTLNDGITDEEAKVVALLGGTYSYRPESADALLRGTGVYLEERVIELPLAGEVLLVIIRIRDQVTPSMDYLEHSVRAIEKFMGEPFPVRYVALFFDDAVFPGSGGTNFGTHFAAQLIYDVEDSYAWDYTPFVIAHEVAHYYWRGSSRDWVDEGAAELLASISEHSRIETPIEPTNNPCASVKTIAELEALEPEDLGAKGFNCNYWLGEAFFLDLYSTLGEDTFQQGFRTLYLKSQHEDRTDDCEGADLSICHMVAAFKTGVSAEVAARVDEITARWYGPIP